MIIRFNEIDNLALKGKTIAFPTDTIYGVGAIVNDEEAISKIYDLKNRDYSKPLVILAANISQIKGLVKDFSLAQKASQFWPGAITFIFRKDNVSNSISKSDTVGIRIPDSKVARDLLLKVGPMAVTSVNLSGEPSAITLEEVRQFEIDYIISDECIGSNKASTVVDLYNMRILREGTVSREELISVFEGLN